FLHLFFGFPPNKRRKYSLICSPVLNLIGLQGVVFCTFLVVGVDFLSIGFGLVIFVKVVAVLGRGVVSAGATFGRSFFIAPGTVIGSGFDVDEGDFEMCLGELGGSKAFGVVIETAELACWIVERSGSFLVSDSAVFVDSMLTVVGKAGVAVFTSTGGDVEDNFIDGKDRVEGSIVDSSVTVSKPVHKRKHH
uniref:Uncharacterized protein n=1 Tax=Meloidogyne javanica TaxID=6303 RepID=A0A915MKM2_MELJA